MLNLQGEKKRLAANRNVLIVLLSASLILSQLIDLANCQASDGDDSFQAYHHDIGRISGSASNSAVAAQTVVRQLEPAAASSVGPAQLNDRPTSHSTRARNSQQQQQQHQQQQVQSAAPRKPQRVTLAVRVHPPAASQFAAEPVFLAARPAPVAAPAAAAAATPPQDHQPDSGGFTPLAAPAGYEPSFQPLAPAEPQVRSLSLSNSVTARHSALMAQVAAERQSHHSALGQIEPASSTQSGGQLDQPTLSSPIEAPASQPIAQVQPPPPLLTRNAGNFNHQQQQQQQQQQAAASPALTFVNRPEEPLVAPSFEQVLSQGCPQKGVFSWENKDYCDRYYMCTNGTFTEEACPNGLSYSQLGAVYQHCAYQWNVDCGTKKTAQPQASAGCPWQFGIFPVESAGRCSIDYFVCEWGVPETKRCTPEGLFYDDRIKGCQWADQLGCKSEALLNFKCPAEDEDNPYWPYPRYYHTKQDVIVCVNEQPRLVHCNEEQTVDPSSLACIDLRPKKMKKKF